jgi:sulfatase modifying factor 1
MRTAAVHVALALLAAAHAVGADVPEKADAAAENEDVGSEQCACGNLKRDKDGSAEPLTRMVPVAATTPEGVASAERHNQEMKQIPGGAFYMGTPKHLVHFPMDGEGPVRQVKVSSFAIDTFEVSNDKFAEFVASEDYTTEAEEFGDSFVAELWLSKAVSGTSCCSLECAASWPVP